MKTIYLDMDGVIADFDKTVWNLMGDEDKYPSKEEYWQKLVKTYPTLFAMLDPMPEAGRLVRGVKSIAAEHGYKVEILTAIPSTAPCPRAETDKAAWVEKHFGKYDLKVNIGPYAKDKQKWAKKGDILIDDFGRNIAQWNAAGGIGIHHKTTADSLARLHRAVTIGECLRVPFAEMFRHPKFW